METINLKLAKFQNHIGHCQLTYTCRNDEGQKLVYCLQEDYPGHLRLMRCTSDGEPSHEVRFTKVKAVFERPTDEPYDSEYASKLKKLVNEWIDNNQ